MDTLQRIGPLVGRLLLAFIFIFAGLHKVTDFSNTVEMIQGKGIPMPELATAIVIAVELGAGLLLAMGLKARAAAIALAIFTLAASLLFHNFWAVPQAEMQEQMNNFMKNMAIIGGLFYVAVYGSGAFSLGRHGAAERRSQIDRRMGLEHYRFAK